MHRFIIARYKPQGIQGYAIILFLIADYLASKVI